MNNIVSITGNKHSGQTKLAFRLSENSAVSFIKPYTDRPVDDLWSDCYHFVSKEKLDELLDEREVLTQRLVNGHRYVYFKDQLTSSYNVMILDDYGVADVMTNYTMNVYSIKVTSKNEKPSKRVGVYLYNHEFSEVFDTDTGSVEELECRIESNLPLR